MASDFPSFDTLFYSATCSDWFWSTSYVEILIAVIESKMQAADFLQMTPLCVTELMKLDVFRTKQH